MVHRAIVMGGKAKQWLHKASIGRLVEQGCDVKAQNPDLTPQVVDQFTAQKGTRTSSDAMELAALIADLQDALTDKRGSPSLFEMG